MSRRAAREAPLVPLACLFLSGAAGLVYEVVWTRRLCLVFGSSVHATSTVLAVFFAGIAIGSLLFGRLSDRFRRPLLLYALLEGGLGLYALLSIPLLDAVGAADARLSDPARPGASLAARVLLSFAVLLLPTILMGGTFPAVCRHFVRKREESGVRVGVLYAVNTFGAVAGTLLAGFALIRLLGMRESLLAAAALNFVVALACSRAATPVETPVETAPQTAPGRPGAGPGRAAVLLVFFFLSGLTALMYEVAWTRALNFFFGSSVYSLSIMLAAFLCGLALGSLWYARQPVRDDRGLAWLGRLQIRIAVSAILFLAVLMILPECYVLAVRWFGGRFLLFQAAQFAVIFGSMLYTTLTFGIAFPEASRLTLLGARRTGAAAGRFYAVNTAGGLVGAIGAGFFLIARIGVDGTVLLAVLLNLGLGFALLAASPGRKAPLALKAAAALALAVLIPFWWRLNRGLLTTGVYATAYRYARVRTAPAPPPPVPGPVEGARPRPSGDSSGPAFPEAGSKEVLLYYKDGLSATVAVYRDPLGVRTLLINGKPDASTAPTGDMRTQLLLAHLPGLFATTDLRAALVIGIGSGTTAGSLGLYPFTRIDAVEIEPAVIEASRFFRDTNLGILDDPRVHLYMEDARRFIRWTPSRYDIITSEPSNLWMAGVANLFTREFFLTARSKLNDGGVFCQWIHLYQISGDDVKCFLRTFREAFPETSVFVDGPDMLVLGSTRPIPDPPEALARPAPPAVLRDLSRASLDGPGDLASAWVGGTALVAAYAGSGPVNTDDRPVLEFTAATHLAFDLSGEIVSSLRAAGRPGGVPAAESAEAP